MPAVRIVPSVLLAKTEAELRDGSGAHLDRLTENGNALDYDYSADNADKVAQSVKVNGGASKQFFLQSDALGVVAYILRGDFSVYAATQDSPAAFVHFWGRYQGSDDAPKVLQVAGLLTTDDVAVADTERIHAFEFTSNEAAGTYREIEIVLVGEDTPA